MQSHKQSRGRWLGWGLGAVLGALVSASAWAQGQSQSWAYGAVLDAAATSRELGLGQRDKGLGLGHSDLFARGALGAQFDVQGIVAVLTHAQQFELELENLWLQTRTLPAGLQLRAGRFASQVGYLNEQHPHTDDFVERPLLYRAFLGGHWFDDGVRLNWTAPTETFVRVGVEALRGKRLGPAEVRGAGPGALTVSTKIGRDVGCEHSWQLGAAWLNNRRQARMLMEPGHDHHEAEHAEEAEHDAAEHAGHQHSARYTGQHMWLLDAVWKWAPEGQSQRTQWRGVLEYARMNRLPEGLPAGAWNDAVSLGAVWRLATHWELGARTDWLRVWLPDAAAAPQARVREHAAMAAYKPSHRQTVRLQLTTQRGAAPWAEAGHQVVQLQYIVGLGAHSAHAY